MTAVVARVRGLSTDPNGPLRQGRYRSPLRDERVAAVLGTALGVLFVLCFLTGLVSHLHQHPPAWFDLPPRPAGLYRVTQGLHVAAGIASIPVVLAKLWIVWPRFLSVPPVRGVAHLVERAGLLPLVGGAVFMVFSGVANTAQWYPWRFSFTAAHFWIAWVTMGALVAHVGAKWAITRRALSRPAAAVAPGQPRPAAAVAPGEPRPAVLGPADEPAGLTRRGLLVTVAGASAVLTLTTVGQTFPPLRRLAVLAPRDPAIGPQGYPVNRSATNAGVTELAQAADYRLTVIGPGGEVAFSLDELADLGGRAGGEASLPIACVEGWSFSARWAGVRLADLVALVGGTGLDVTVESLEPAGAYRTSTLNPDQAGDRDTLLATHLDGEPLALDHGFPCRLIAPNRPGVLQTKWVTRVVAR